MADVPEQLARWERVGRRVADGRLRRRPRLSMRQAAKEAGISEAHWRLIEHGGRTIQGVRLPPQVSQQVVEDVARVLGIPRRELFAELGWECGPESDAELVGRLELAWSADAELRLSRLERLMGEVAARLDRIEPPGSGPGDGRGGG